MPRHVITDQYKVHNAFYSPSALTPHTLLPPLQGAARRTKRNFRATSKAGSPLCAAALTSLWIALMSTFRVGKVSPMGAMGERSAHFRNCAM